MPRSKMGKARLNIDRIERKYIKNGRRIDKLQRNQLEIKQFLVKAYVTLGMTPKDDSQKV